MTDNEAVGRTTLLKERALHIFSARLIKTQPKVLFWILGGGPDDGSS